MSILIDTHVFIWASSGESTLSVKAVDLLTDPDEVIFFSAASSWEIAIKWSKGGLDLPGDPSTFIPEALSNSGYSQLSVNVRDSCLVANLPFHHKDPFDRLLIAQAKANEMRLFSNDPIFKKYDVDVFWV
ncbi:MAG: type II toxin-antitoxin system VapC family toxin [Saprospiraceae bacterium]|nr:type II toxin-antitoxin system VapC family toxin [Pyrinomonadaceae bacterium]